jgi:hypothetical protein
MSATDPLSIIEQAYRPATSLTSWMATMAQLTMSAVDAAPTRGHPTQA